MNTILTAFEPNENKIYVCNPHNLEFEGNLIIKYFGQFIYQNKINFQKNMGVLWFSPFKRMKMISEISIIITDNNGGVYDTPLLYYNRFMRGSDEELNDMSNFIKNNGNDVKTIIEIGTFQGEAARILSENFKDAKIFTVDPWMSGWDDLDWTSKDPDMKEVEYSYDTLTKNNDNIIKIKMKSEDFSKIISDNSIDLIYIDGDHRYEGITNDIACWKSKVKKGGYLGGHDYNEYATESIIKAIRENFPDKKEDVFNMSWLIKYDE